MPYCTTDWYVSNRVGIGTDNPGFRLVICDTTVPLIQLKNSSNVGFGVVLEHNGVNSEYWNYENGHIRLGTANVERLRITNTGNIGIGTSSPSATLHVTRNENQDNIGTIRYENANTGTGSSTNAQLLGVNKYGCGQYMMWEEKGMRIGLRSVTSSGCGDLHFTAGSDSTKMVIRCNGNIDVQSGGTLNIYRADNARALQLYTTNDETVINSWEASSEPLHIRSMGTGGRIQFFTSGAERLRINCAGNVGIGTSSPSQKFHVAGTSLFTDTMNFELGKISWNSTRFVITSCGTANIAFATDDFTDRMTIQCGTGNVGIGTSSPANIIHAYKPSGTATLALQVGGNYGYFFMNGCCMAIGSDSGTSGIKFHISRQAPDDSMLITQAGNVGINTTSPSYRLHVNGTFYAAGSSIKYKEGICNYDTDSCLFMCLKPVTYQYKDEWKHLGKDLKSETQIGLIAEEVAESHPELAILVNEEDNKVVRNVDYEKLSIILLSEVQKLRQEVDDLKNKQ